MDDLLRDELLPALALLLRPVDLWSLRPLRRQAGNDVLELPQNWRAILREALVQYPSHNSVKRVSAYIYIQTHHSIRITQ